MSDWYMLTLVGKDRPGIVARLATALFDAGCNLGETSMIRLGNNFTVMMMVRSGSGISSLRKAVEPVADALRLILHVDEIEAELHRRQNPDVCILVHGADRAGIVARVTSAAADAGLNIVDLESDVGGTDAKPIYILQISGVAEKGVDAIRDALMPLQADGIKIDVSALDTLIG